MPPVDGSALAVIQENLAKHPVMVFSKTTCSYCAKVKQLFNSLNIKFGVLELDQLPDGASIQEGLLALTGQKTVPNVFINKQHIGGCDKTHSLHADGKLLPLLEVQERYDYDLIVLGGGSGGLAAAKEAAKLGKKVAVCDFVKPSPKGTTWGLGGTCVNVGCIPKKLMHQAALLGHNLEDARAYGWEFDTQVKHNWTTMRDAIQDHIGSLNWGYRVALREKTVKYLNAYATFVEPHKIQATDKSGKAEVASAKHFIIATGLRPKYLDIPGGEHAVSSDDLFSLPYCPGKTLCVGASYISLECAGFLAGIGLQATVMVRSILLRGFDQQMAEMVGSYMEKHGVRFVRGAIPTKIEQVSAGEPGLYRVTAISDDGSTIVDEYNTILFAIGREARTADLGLDKVGVQLNPKNGKVIGRGGGEQSSVDHVYAIGDVLDGKPELTPVAIEAGRLLAQRLYGDAGVQCDYINVPTTVFTPLEYGAIGLSEEDAIAQYGEDDVEVYHSNFTPLEWTVPHREDNICYAKLVCVKSLSERVVGFHVVAPNAGEMTQGYGVAMKCGATKAHFDATIGIHPTCTEIFTTLDTTKASGASTLQAGC